MGETGSYKLWVIWMASHRLCGHLHSGYWVRKEESLSCCYYEVTLCRLAMPKAGRCLGMRTQKLPKCESGPVRQLGVLLGDRMNILFCQRAAKTIEMR